MNPANLFDLRDRVAVVTGGNGGIGLGIAQGLASAGAQVLIAARNPEKNKAACATLTAQGAQVVAVEADVASKDDWQLIVRQALASFGRIDILVNNAGILLGKPAEAYSLEEWHAIIDVNLTGAFLGAQAVYPELKRQGGGKIINVASLTSLLGSAFNVPYTASKGGMLQLTRGLATAWARENIQVNAVLPGWIDTDLATAARARVPGIDDKILARTPAGRWGKAEDFAGVAVFLASQSSNFVNGAAITVDGGYSIAL